MQKRRGSTASRHPFIIHLAAMALVLATVTTARAQDARQPAELLEDFVFYALTANPELAAANAQALMGMGLSDAELAELLDETGKTSVQRFDDAVLRAQRIEDYPDLENMAAELANRIEQGRLDLARDPGRIDEAIQMLTGPQRQRLIARRRLTTAGEYAVPGLLKQITEGQDQRLTNQCIDVLTEVGRQAVGPLSEALIKLGDPRAQRVVCDVLADIAYPTAAAPLMELSLDPNAEPATREVADRAFRRVGGVAGDLSDLYTDLGRRYFSEHESLVAYPLESTNNVWDYDPFIGLVPTPVPTPVFTEVMAMRMAARALDAREDNAEALSLFVAANLKRENELPPASSDPIFGQSPYTPDFYATVYGTQTAMDVLAMAIDSVNTPLVRDAIRALGQTTGGANLYLTDTGRQPLLEALQFPDRRAQYEAAITLARALPSGSFAGDYAVVPLLASAVRTGARMYALIVADDPEDRRVMANMLEAMGFDIAGAEASVDSLQAAVADAVGIDLVVVKKPTVEQAIEAVTALRQTPKTNASPVLIQAGAIDKIDLDREYRGDRRVLVGRAGLGEPELLAQVESVLDAAAGGMMSEAEAEVYAIEALAALRDIAISRSAAFDIADAESSLIDALDERSGGVRMMVADILALIDTERSQRSLWDAALIATGPEQNDLLEDVAISVKRWGSYAQPHHVDGLIDLIRTSGGDTAEAAARVHG
ncbi:MAG: response regulator, partial [Planctomycetota bacterium]